MSERQIQLRIEKTARGPIAVLTPEGESVQYSENSGFFELTKDGGKTPDTPENLFRDLNTSLPSDAKNRPVLIEEALLRAMKEGEVVVPAESGVTVLVDQMVVAGLLAEVAGKKIVFQEN